MAKWHPGSHGGTYGGNIVACAAAVATLQAMRDENMIENAASMGVLLMSGLRRLQEDHPEIGDVRGLGLMLGTEFTSPTGAPWTERAKAVAHACLDKDLMLITCGAWDNTIRWIPPLIVDDTQIRQALSVFEEALGAAAA
jgi:4-aminobutyrate aminotransferase